MEAPAATPAPASAVAAAEPAAAPGSDVSESSDSSDDDELDVASLKLQRVALSPAYSQLAWSRRVSTIPRRPQLKAYTLAQVAQHADPARSVWMVLRGKVYDVTEYLPYHPGGKATLLRGAGKDATKMYDQVHAFVNAETLMGPLCIGHLVPE